MFRRLAGLALLAASAFAGAQQYAQTSHGIRAGIVIVDSQQAAPGVPANPSPHVWYNFDADRKIKPISWNLVNPNAVTQVNDVIAQRWTALSVVVGGGAPAVGDRISKREAAYWEVQLSKLTDSQIAQYDVLMLPCEGYVSLNSLERERLRQYVDRGGLLWVNLGGTQEVVNTLPLPATVGGPANGVRNADLFHPLLSYPYQLDLQDLRGIDTGSTAGLAQIDLSGTAIDNIESWVRADWIRLRSIVTVGNTPTIMVGKLGDGFVMYTCRLEGNIANVPDWSLANNASNRGYYGTTPVTNQFNGAMFKLLTNFISLASTYSQAGGGSRKSNSILADMPAPALRKLEFPVAINPGSKNYFPPVAYKGTLIFAGSDGRVYALDADPQNDLDGDGDPDDGLRDYSLGSTFDMLWTSAPLATPISAPTCFEVPASAGLPSDQVAVVDGNGNVVGFDVFQLQNGRITGTSSASSAYSLANPSGSAAAIDTAAAGHGPYAVTFQEGLLFVADNGQPGFGGQKPGRVWVIDPATGTVLSPSGPAWSIGGSTSPVIPELSGSATVGYIPIADNSGGLDKVVYVPTRPGGSFSPNASAGVYSLWFGVRGESPTPGSVTIAPGLLSVSTRASRQGLEVFIPSGGANPTQRSLGVKLTVIKPNGDPLTTTEMDNLFTGSVAQTGGVLSFGLKAAFDPTYNVRLDYTIDWGTGNPALTGQIVRGQLFFPDNQNLGANKRRVIGNIAMSPRGTIYAAVSTQNTAGVEAGGSFYALREEGRGAFRLLYRYDLYGPHTITLNQTSPVSYPATFADNDPLISVAPPLTTVLGGAFNLLTFQGTPSVRGDTVYVTASARKVGFPNSFIPHTVLMAFKAEPEAVEIKTGSLGDNFTILQPDVTRSPNPQTPNVYNILQPGQYVYEKRPGSDTGTIRIDNLMSTNRGPIVNALSTSQPIIIRRSGQPDLLIDPGNSGSRWSPLLWYTVLHGVDTQSGAFVAGETLYAAGSSALPQILINGNYLQTVGLLMAMKAEISPTDPFLGTPDTSRPWLKQLYRLAPDPLGIKANPDFLWPQSTGSMTFLQWRQRLLQTTLPGSTTAYGVVGGEGNLLSWSDAGLYAFSRADFFVADEGRFARIDPGGNLIYSSDTMLKTGDVANGGGAGSLQPLVRPTRAYRVGATGVAVVDPGSNRVVRMDLTGKVLRSISGFMLDPARTPDGYTTNEPTTLNDPRDVAVFTSYEANPVGVSNPQPLEFWYHYVIADAGNKRLIEVIDRYVVDPNTRQIGDLVLAADTQGNVVPQVGVLIWHSAANLSGKLYNYTSVARTFVQANGQYQYVAGVGGSLPTRVDTGLDQPTANPGALRESGDGNGAIVIFDPFNPANNQVINQVQVPQVAQDVFYNEGTGNFASPVEPQHVKMLGNLRSVTVAPNGSSSAIMFTDSSGVYEIVPGGSTGWQVRWMLPNKAYRVMRWLAGTPVNVLGSNPRQFNAMYARRLDSGEILVVNGYVGTTRANNEFNGEVVQIDGDIDNAPGPNTTGFNFSKVNLGFDSLSVRFELPPIKDARGILLPVFADRR